MVTDYFFVYSYFFSVRKKIEKKFWDMEIIGNKRKILFLARQTDIKYGVLDGGSTMNFFKTSNLPVFQTMWEFMSGVERPNVMVSMVFCYHNCSDVL